MLPKLLHLLMKCLLPTFLISTTFLSWILSTANSESKKPWSSLEHPARSASFPEKSCELLTSHFLEVMRCWPKGGIGAYEFGTFKGVAHKTYFCNVIYATCRCSFIACWVHSRSYSTKKITLLRVIPTMTCWVEVVRWGLSLRIWWEEWRIWEHWFQVSLA